MHLNIYLLSISMHIYGVTSQLSIKIKDQIQLNSKLESNLCYVSIFFFFWWQVKNWVQIEESKSN